MAAVICFVAAALLAAHGMDGWGWSCLSDFSLYPIRDNSLKNDMAPGGRITQNPPVSDLQRI
ncbi:TPA: hypothetical protein R4H00_000677 [Salmonella enterica subsp. enterica serovar Orientalis]|nr:hypothetical protein [Salmonella enterica subsp. enterica serovar Orientalis]